MVDFAPELYEIITETKYMEQLGFHVPELARNVSLQVSQALLTEGCIFFIIVPVSFCSYTGSYLTYRLNSLELIELSSVNKVSLVRIFVCSNTR